MEGAAFHTPENVAVTAVTAEEMREVDRVATEEIGLELLQMMENAGRSLASHTLQLREHGPVVIVAGGGGNGGGGLAAARHLANREIAVTVVLDRDPVSLDGATATQRRILESTDAAVTTDDDPLWKAGIVVDALIGYGLTDAPRGPAETLIETVNEIASPVVSLDVPTGVNATDGSTPGAAVVPDRTLTLALPKTGLRCHGGALYLADIGIPTGVYRRLEIPYVSPFLEAYWTLLDR